MMAAKIDKNDLFKVVRLFLAQQGPFFQTTIIYSVGVSILGLGVPISVQFLVNTVAFGSLYQPLLILSLVLLAFLIFSGILKALQAYIIEMLQRSFYVKTTTDMTSKLLMADYKRFNQYNAEEVVNRYFDVITVQKSTAHLLTTGISILLQTVVGLILLGLYHPYFIFFDILLIFMLYLMWSIFYKKALETAVKESKEKYNVAGWLENIARTNFYLKSKSRRQRAMAVADERVHKFLDAREGHFKQVFGQSIFLLAIYAFMSAIILGLSGYLVIIDELTLGQLVASELVVTVMLANFAKSGKLLESFYDLYAALDKISFFHELPEEKNTQTLPKLTEQCQEVISFKNVEVNNKGQTFSCNMSFNKSQNYLISSEYYSNRFIFLQLIQVLTAPTKGHIYYQGQELRDYDPSYLRDEILLIDRPHIIQAPIIENLEFGIEGIGETEITKALNIVDLDHINHIFDDGLDTMLRPSGHPLWPSQLIRLELAKAILRRPKVLVISEVIEQVEKSRLRPILDYFFKSDTTLIILSNHDFENYSFNKVFHLSRNTETESAE